MKNYSFFSSGVFFSVVVVVAFLFWILIQSTCFPSMGSLTWERYFSLWYYNGHKSFKMSIFGDLLRFSGASKNCLDQISLFKPQASKLFLKRTDIFQALWGCYGPCCSNSIFFSFKDYFSGAVLGSCQNGGQVKRFLIYPQPSVCITFSPLLIFHTRVAHWL